MKFEGKCIDFGPGLCVVSGPNEAGKSSLQRFVQVMLYGCPEGNPELRQAVIPWSKNEAVGKLIISVDVPFQRKLRVERTIREDRPSHPTIYDHETNEDLSAELEAAGNFPESIFGLTENAFRRTVWVEQASLSENVSPDKPTVERIRNLAAGGPEDISPQETIRSIEEALESLGTDRSTKRPLDELENRLQRKRQELEDALEKHRALMHKEKELRKAKNESKKLSAKKDNASSRLFAVRYIELRGKVEKIQEQRQVVENLGKKCQDLSDYEDFPAERETDIKRLTAQLQARAEEVSEHVGRLHRCLKRLAALRTIAAHRAVELGNKLNKCKLAPENIRSVAREAMNKHERLQSAEKHVKDLEGAEHRERLLKARRSLMRKFLIAGGVLEFGALLLGTKHWFGFFLAVLIPIIVYVLFRTSSSSYSEELGALEEELQEAKKQAQERRRLYQECIHEAGASKLQELRQWADIGQRFCKTRDAEQQANDYLEKRLKEFQGKALALSQQTDGLAQRMESWSETGDLLQQAASLEDVGGEATPGTTSDDLAAGVEEANRRTVTALQELSELGKKVRSVQEERANVLQEIGVESIPGFKRALNTYETLQNLKREKAQAQKRLEQLTEEGNEDEINERIDKLCSEFEKRFERDLDLYMLEHSLDSEALPERDELQKQIDELNEQEKDAEKQQVLIKRDLNQLQQECADVRELQSELEALERKKTAMKEHRSLLRKTLDGLNKAEEEMQRTFLPRLNEEFNEIAEKITASNSRRFNMDDLAKIQVTETQTRPLSNLSFGTTEQIYLSLRLALARVATVTGETLPLLLDEPFASADADRLENAMQMLADWSQDYQVIVFTCHEHIVRAAQNAAKQTVDLIRLQ
ncbi:MAG: AAA family ATPase [Planctomycetes bacterium]|nr:AAA family ATPase [Planctomycetota bacterium]